MRMCGGRPRVLCCRPNLGSDPQRFRSELGLEDALVATPGSTARFGRQTRIVLASKDPTRQGGVRDDSNAVGGRVEYVRTLTPRIDLRSYGETESVLNGPICNTYGGGLGIGVRMTHSVEFDVRGGPQWSTATCGAPQSANFSASMEQ